MPIEDANGILTNNTRRYCLHNSTYLFAFGVKRVTETLF